MNGAGENFLAERVFHLALNGAAQGPCAILRIKSRFGQQGHRLGRDLQFDATFRQPLAHRLEHQRRNPVDVLFRELVEYDDLVHAVEEFRPEYLLNFLHDVVAHLLIGFFAAIRAAKTHGALLFDGLHTGVGGHHDHGILEIHHAALPIRQPAVFQNLQEHVEHIRMRLFHFIQEHDGIRLPAHFFRELAAFFIADIAWRRADHARNGVFFHIFAHIDANQAVFIAKERFAQRFAQLRFAHAGGAQEDKGTNGTLRVFDARARAPHGARHGRNGLILPDHAAVQGFLQVQEAFGLTLRHTGNRNARPRRNDLRHFFFAHDFHAAFAALLPFLAALGNFILQALLFIAQLGGLFKILMRHGFFGFLAQRFQTRFLFLHIRRRGERLDAHARSRLVDEVDRLIRQEPVGNVAIGKLHSRFNGLIRDAHAVMRLVAVAQAVQNRHAFLFCGLADHHRLEAALQRRILFDIFVVFVERSRAHALQFPARQEGLHDVRRVDGTFARARAHHRVQLIDEQNHVPGLLDFGHGVLQALFKFAPVFCAGHHTRQIQRNHALAAQDFRNVAFHDQLRQAFHNGGFAHARLADEHGVVLRAAR